MKVLGSNIIIAYFRKDENKHEEAKEIIDKEEFFLVLDVVLSEVYTVLLMRESWEVAKEALSWILTDSMFLVVRAREEDLNETAEFLKNNKSKLSFVDALILVFAKNRKVELISFDGEVKKNFE